MLRLMIPKSELWDEMREEFVTCEGGIITVEHSLISLAKWESRWNKPFLSKERKTTEETIDYIRCMTLTQNVNQSLYLGITDSIIQQINQYIEAPMTATTFKEATNSPRNREQVTAELIYYWMIALNIPFECQKWHLNRLLTLIKVCSIKNKPPKKMSKSQILSRNAALNAERRKQYNSKG